MRSIRLFAFLSITSIILTTSSCSKNQLGKLEGTWEYINFDDLDNLEYTYTWIFDAGEVRVNRYAAPSPSNPFPEPEHVNTGSYNTKSGFSKASIEILDLADDRQNIIFEATWTIADIDNDVLRLSTKDIGGHVIREFKRFE